MSSELVYVDRTGIFRGHVLSWRLKEYEDSKAVCVSIKWSLDQILTPDYAWEDWHQYCQYCWGNTWVQRKDGSLQEDRVDDLISKLNWDGDWGTIANNKIDALTPAQIRIQEEKDKKGDIHLAAVWIEYYDFQPKRTVIDEDSVKRLEQRHKSKVSAILRNRKRGQRPVPPPATPVTPETDRVEHDDVPF